MNLINFSIIKTILFRLGLYLGDYYYLGGYLGDLYELEYTLYVFRYSRIFNFYK